MKKLRISTERVLSYKTRLHSLLSSITEEGQHFVGSRWAKSNRAGGRFVTATKNLGYITIHGKGRKNPIYVAKLAPEKVEPVHARNVYEEVSRLVGERGKKKEPEVVNTPLVPEPKLSYSDRELVDELRRRGYTGKLTRSETLEI